jgi:hypothetical protein
MQPGRLDSIESHNTSEKDFQRAAPSHSAASILPILILAGCGKSLFLQEVGALAPT